jgi:hypothetical protein
MRDLGNALNEEPGDPMADPDNQWSLEPIDSDALVQRQESGEHRTKLYARLRNIIDNATESIRHLKEENATLAARNAEMTDRIGMLEQRIRAVTTDLANDERELRKSAEALEQALHGASAARPAPAVADTPPALAEPTTDAAEDDSPTMESPVPQPAMPGSEEEEEAEAEPEPEAAMPVGGQAVAAPAMDDAAPILPQPAAPPVTGDENERVIAPRPASDAGGMYTLIASPFVRFSDLGQFQAALQKLTGVHDVQVRRFAQGTLEMRIGYSGATDLETTLRTLAAEIEDVREEEPYQLRVRLRTNQGA